MLKRSFLTLFTLLVISVIAFSISKLTPGDPVAFYITGGDENVDLNNPSVQRNYKTALEILGYNKPDFYLSIAPAIYPDTLHY
ncbi:MAG: hypothetical protein AAFO07_30610, partial [Bacteroidota bacterium]